MPSDAIAAERGVTRAAGTTFESLALVSNNVWYAVDALARALLRKYAPEFFALTDPSAAAAALSGGGSNPSARRIFGTSGPAKEADL